MLGRQIDAGQTVLGVCICQVRFGSLVDSLYYFPTIVFLLLLYSLSRRLDAGQTVHCLVIYGEFAYARLG